MTYIPPERELKFALHHFADIEIIAGPSGFDEDLIAPILQEAAKIARDELSPVNQVGDQFGAQWNQGSVSTPPGFKEAYIAMRAGGWVGLSAPELYGGQALPKVIQIAVMEMFHSANMALALCPMLSQGAIEAILGHGTDQQKSVLLPRLIAGEWTGTMNLTEPHAGSDVGSLRTQAKAQKNGSYKLYGTKTYITWGEHDLAENIIHLVLARTPDAPEGSKGVSLFICPKWLYDEKGRLTSRNDVNCIGIEKKLGIHASPTCSMDFNGAQAWLLGDLNCGLEAMFKMMNSARLSVGLEGVAIAEAAYQNAQAYAHDRRQGKSKNFSSYSPIIYHKDVQRTLTKMHAYAMAGRAICFACAGASDVSDVTGDNETERRMKRREDLLTPIAKAWSTDLGVEVASDGIQIHGGLGYMDETLAAQLYRDVRITPIYEGTNGIQAIDLAIRKISYDHGRAMFELLDEASFLANRARSEFQGSLKQVGEFLSEGIAALRIATNWMLSVAYEDREQALSGATAYLRLSGDVLAGFFLLKAALETHQDNAIEAQNFRRLVAFYAVTVLAFAPRALPGILSVSDALEEVVH